MQLKKGLPTARCFSSPRPTQALAGMFDMAQREGTLLLVGVALSSGCKKHSRI